MFKQQMLTVFGIINLIVFLSVNTLAAKQPAKILTKKQLVEELTGRPISQFPSSAELKNKPLSTQHYYAGLRAAEQKNYIKAIKHLNTVLKKYPQSAEAKMSFKAKANIYTKMGLLDQANYNLARASNLKMNAPLKINTMASSLNKNVNKVTASGIKKSRQAQNSSATNKKVNR